MERVRITSCDEGAGTWLVCTYIYRAKRHAWQPAYWIVILN